MSATHIMGDVRNGEQSKKENFHEVSESSQS
jgi:hypothetical protein